MIYIIHLCETEYRGCCVELGKSILMHILKINETEFSEMIDIALIQKLVILDNGHLRIKNIAFLQSVNEECDIEDITQNLTQELLDLIRKWIEKYPEKDFLINLKDSTALKKMVRPPDEEVIINEIRKKLDSVASNSSVHAQVNKKLPEVIKSDSEDSVSSIEIKPENSVSSIDVKGKPKDEILKLKLKGRGPEIIEEVNIYFLVSLLLCNENYISIQ